MKPQLIAAWCIIMAFILVVLIAGKYLLRPLAVAIVMTFLINTLANFFGRLGYGQIRFPRWLAFVAAFITILGFVALSIEIMIGTVNNMITSASDYQIKLEALAEELLVWVGLDPLTQSDNLFGDYNIKPLIANLASGLSAFAGKLILVIVYVIFLLLEQEFFRKKFNAFFENNDDYLRAAATLRRIAESVRTYLSVKAFTSLLTALLCYTALLFIGLKHAALWAFIIFLFNFIPNIGSWVATALPVLFAMVQFDNTGMILTTLIVVGTIQLIVGNYIDPRMMGYSLNISPIVVLFSLVFWGAIWGVLGMVLSVPITVALLIIFAQFPETRKIAMFLSRSGNLASLNLPDQKGLQVSPERQVSPFDK